MGKLTISMAIFNSYVSHYQRVDSPNSGCFPWIFHLRCHQVVDDLRLFARIGDGEGCFLPHAELRVSRHDGEPGVERGIRGVRKAGGFGNTWKQMENLGKPFWKIWENLEKRGKNMKERKEKLVKFSQIMRSHLLLVAIGWMKHE